MATPPVNGNLMLYVRMGAAVALVAIFGYSIYNDLILAKRVYAEAEALIQQGNAHQASRALLEWTSSVGQDSNAHAAHMLCTWLSEDRNGQGLMTASPQLPGLEENLIKLLDFATSFHSGLTARLCIMKLYDDAGHTTVAQRIADNLIAGHETSKEHDT